MLPDVTEDQIDTSPLVDRDEYDRLVSIHGWDELECLTHIDERKQVIGTPGRRFIRDRDTGAIIAVLRQ